MDEQDYDYLRKEIWDERLRAKMTPDYYGAIARRLEWYHRILNFVSFCCIILAAYMVTNRLSEYLVVALALCSAVANVSTTIFRWQGRSYQFVLAQSLSRELEDDWDVLWNETETRLFGDSKEVIQKINRLKRRDSDIQQRVQPHVLDKKLVATVQNDIVLSLGITEMEEQDGERSKTNKTDQKANG